jgi:hypothetical protein
MIDWSIDFLKTASGASQVYDVDYTSALLGDDHNSKTKKVSLLALFYVILVDIYIKKGR